MTEIMPKEVSPNLSIMPPEKPTYEKTRRSYVLPLTPEEERLAKIREQYNKCLEIQKLGYADNTEHSMVDVPEQNPRRSNLMEKTKKLLDSINQDIDAHNQQVGVGKKIKDTTEWMKYLEEQLGIPPEQRNSYE